MNINIPIILWHPITLQKLTSKVCKFTIVSHNIWSINPFASPRAGAPALKYGYVNTLIPSPGEAKGLIVPKKMAYSVSRGTNKVFTIIISIFDNLPR